MTRLARLLLVLAIPATLPGCVAQMVLDSQDQQNYSSYVVQTEKINTTREENHLQPDKIMTFDEWKGTSS